MLVRVEYEGISTIYSEYAGFRKYLGLLSFSVFECMLRTSFEGPRYAPVLRPIIESHVDDGVILVTVERNEVAMGESLVMFGGYWRVSEAMRTDVLIIRTLWIGFGDVC